MTRKHTRILMIIASLVFVSSAALASERRWTSNKTGKSFVQKKWGPDSRTTFVRKIGDPSRVSYHTETRPDVGGGWTTTSRGIILKGKGQKISSYDSPALRELRILTWNRELAVNVYKKDGVVVRSDSIHNNGMTVRTDKTFSLKTGKQIGRPETFEYTREPSAFVPKFSEELK